MGVEPLREKLLAPELCNRPSCPVRAPACPLRDGLPQRNHRPQQLLSLAIIVRAAAAPNAIVFEQIWAAAMVMGMYLWQRRGNEVVLFLRTHTNI